MYIRTIDIWKVVKGLFKSIDGGNEFSLNLFYCTFRNRDDPFFPLVLLTPDPDATAEKLILSRHWSRNCIYLFSLGILRVHIKEQSSSAKSQLSFKTATGWHE